MTGSDSSRSATLASRVERLDWDDAEASLRSLGYFRGPRVLEPNECRRLIALYADDGVFRSRIDMERHGFGVGSYAYFAEPLPADVATLRSALYAPLAPIASRWQESLGRAERYPGTLDAYREHCRALGQTKPTPLLLRYEAGGYNRLHRDLYGEVHFPFQVTVLLSERDKDFGGGEFLLVENVPRSQARGDAVPLVQGELLIFPVFERPVAGRRGLRRAEMRHGVSRLHWGERYALGVIFHDAA
jgi:hypothetical protein